MTIEKEIDWKVIYKHIELLEIRMKYAKEMIKKNETYDIVLALRLSLLRIEKILDDAGIKFE